MTLSFRHQKVHFTDGMLLIMHPQVNNTQLSTNINLLSKCYTSNTIYKCPATATVHNLLCFAVFSLFNRYRKNCKKKAKCSCDKCDAVNLMHCRNAFTCSHISNVHPFQSAHSTRLEVTTAFMAESMKEVMPESSGQEVSWLPVEAVFI